MYTVDLIDFILELEPKRDFLIECLFCLLVVFHQHILIILQVLVLIPQQF